MKDVKRVGGYYREKFSIHVVRALAVKDSMFLEKGRMKLEIVKGKMQKLVLFYIACYSVEAMTFISCTTCQFFNEFVIQQDLKHIY